MANREYGGGGVSAKQKKITKKKKKIKMIHQSINNTNEIKKKHSEMEIFLTRLIIHL